jgi:hypothetical protein
MREIEMVAGPDLDALVAEKVMGWRKVPRRVINDRDLGPGWWHPTKGDPESPNPGASAFPPPSYTTDIAAAWDVVETLNKKGIYLWAVGQEDSFPGWSADFGRNHQSAHVAWGETAPLAICRAALKASE